MKLRNVSIFFVFIFCLLIVMFCQPSDESMSEETKSKDEFENALHVSDDAKALFEQGKAKEHLREDIMDNFKGKLIDLFDKDDFIEMDRILAKKHVILEDTTSDYGRVKSNDQYKRLFKQAKEKKQEEYKDKKIILEIRITHISVDKLMETKYIEGDSPEEKELDMIARFTFTYHIKPNGGSSAENQGGGGSGESLHRRVCDWY